MMKKRILLFKQRELVGVASQNLIMKLLVQAVAKVQLPFEIQRNDHG
ncbi:hypothetical protein A2U01_0030740, partial [Trifolium medium]|nr:hypothetical protein [Trifolium medium]